MWLVLPVGQGLLFYKTLNSQKMTKSQKNHKSHPPCLQPPSPSALCVRRCKYVSPIQMCVTTLLIVHGAKRLQSSNAVTEVHNAEENSIVSRPCKASSSQDPSKRRSNTSRCVPRSAGSSGGCSCQPSEVRHHKFQGKETSLLWITGSQRPEFYVSYF